MKSLKSKKSFKWLKMKKILRIQMMDQDLTKKGGQILNN